MLLVDALGHFPTGRSIRSVTLVSLRSIRSIRIATFSPETTWHCDFARHDLITHPGALALRQMASSPSLLALKTSGKEFFATETTPALSRHIYEAQLATSPDTQGPRGHQERCAKGGGRRRSSGTLRLLLGLAVQSQRCRDIFCASRIERALPRTLAAANLGPPFTRPTTAPLCHQLRRCLDLAGDPIIIQEHAITASSRSAAYNRTFRPAARQPATVDAVTALIAALIDRHIAPYFAMNTQHRLLCFFARHTKQLQDRFEFRLPRAHIMRGHALLRHFASR